MLANFFMGHYEKLWLNNYTGPKVLYYRRYVDDIICCFRNSNDARLFFEYLNSCHPNIKFTMETEERGQLPFLDVLLSKQSVSDRQGSFITSVYRKKTFTGLLTNYFSFTPFKYKLGLIKTLIDRAYKINNTTQGWHRLKAGLDSGLDSGLWTLDSGLWTLDSGLWTLDSGLWTLDPGLWTLDYFFKIIFNNKLKGHNGKFVQ